MIHPKYLPDNFIFRDPSKMKKTHYKSLLEHWYTRQEDDSIKITFSFKGYWDSSSGSVVAVANKNAANRKQSKKFSGKRRITSELTTSKPMHNKLKVARAANPSRSRRGPPGVRQGDKGWESGSGDSGKNDGGEGDKEDEGEDEDEYEDEEEEVDEEEGGENDDDGDGNNRYRQQGMPSKAPPKDLPFAAKRKVDGGAPVAPKKNTSRLPGLKSRVLEIAVAKRPQPRPAYHGLQGDDAALAPHPVKDKPARKPSPQFERPVTRNGGKRKVDGAELQAIGEPPSKKGKKRL